MHEMDKLVELAQSVARSTEREAILQVLMEELKNAENLEVMAVLERIAGQIQFRHTQGMK